MGTDFSVLFITVSSCPSSFCFICSCESHPLNRFEFLMSLDFSSSLTGFLQNYEEILLMQIVNLLNDHWKTAECRGSRQLLVL